MPTTKYLYGDTFGKASIKYFQDVRAALMSSKGGMLPGIYSNDGALIAIQHSQNRNPAFHPTYWARYNIDFKRQRDINLFNEVRN